MSLRRPVAVYEEAAVPRAAAVTRMSHRPEKGPQLLRLLDHYCNFQPNGLQTFKCLHFAFVINLLICSVRVSSCPGPVLCFVLLLHQTKVSSQSSSGTLLHPISPTNFPQTAVLTHLKLSLSPVYSTSAVLSNLTIVLTLEWNIPREIRCH